MRKLFLLVVTIAIIFFAGFATLIWVGYETFLKMPAADSKTVTLAVPSGGSAADIGRLLKQDGLISSEWLFKGYVWLTGSGPKFQVGIYDEQTGLNVSRLVKDLTSSWTQKAISVTIPEGYTLAQIGDLVHLKLGISIEDWQQESGADSPFEDKVPFLKDKPDSVDLEGYLFPDTYYFSQHATAEDVVRTMLETMDKRLNEHNDELGSVLKAGDLHEILTLASIIEREVMIDADRGNVADIFAKRLAIGMALQADSTVNYVTGKKTPGISLDDRSIDSPYNTYKYPGLPPGPIANPGIASILAATHPTPNDYYYFLTTTDGTVIYAKTYAEHVANKARYR